MAYQKITNVGGPDLVLAKIRDFAAANGWTILENLTADLPINDGSVSDGLRLVIQQGDIIAHFPERQRASDISESNPIGIPGIEWLHH